MGLIERLFGKPETPQGLETFTSGLQQVVNNDRAAQRQRVLDARNAENARMLAEAAKRAEIEKEQRELEDKKAAAMTEAEEILNQFRIRERLNYIKRTIWGGKGKIVQIEPSSNVRPSDTQLSDKAEYDSLGGLKLVHQYPLFILLSQTVYLDDSSREEWQYEPMPRGTSINITVLKPHLGKGQKILNIYSEGEIGRRKEGTYVHDPHYFTYDFSHQYDEIRGSGTAFDKLPGYESLYASIPVGLQESTALLDSALLEEANFRIVNGFLPSQLEGRARAVLQEVKRKPAWLKWQGYRLGL